MQIVIIGSGVLGASAAFHLARAGETVTVVDAQRDGRATAAGAGIICPWVSGVEDAAFYRLYAGGGEYYPDLVAALTEAGETDLGYRRSGAMLVSEDPQELAWIERMARQRAVPAMGAITRLSASEARGLFPPLRPGLGGVHVAGGARVDGRRLAVALLRAAERYGATIRHGEAALAVEASRIAGVDITAEDAPAGMMPAQHIPSGMMPAQHIPSGLVPAPHVFSGRVPSGRVPSGRVPADRVILTAGAWAPRVLHPLGLGLPVEPQRGQIVHLRLEGSETADWPVILPPGSHYIVPFDDGRIVVGATRETGAGFDYRVTASGQAEVLAEALRIAPGLEAATLLETRVGFRPASADGRPLLGWVRGIEGLAVGNGLGAVGLTIGPLAGRLLAELVAGRTTMLDLAPFDPMRHVGSPAAAAMALR
jgi:glycine/D-amino acid oxidase-like deaminating enzyme